MITSGKFAQVPLYIKHKSGCSDIEMALTEFPIA